MQRYTSTLLVDLGFGWTPTMDSYNISIVRSMCLFFSTTSVAMAGQATCIDEQQCMSCDQPKQVSGAYRGCCIEQGMIHYKFPVCCRNHYCSYQCYQYYYYYYYYYYRTLSPVAVDSALGID